MSRIVITGAGGFVGQPSVAAARAIGHEVTAILRPGAAAPEGWVSDNGIIVREADLETLGEDIPWLSGAEAVIHAAAGQGDDAAHARATVAPTAALARGCAALGIRFVLVSSFSVYGYSAMPTGAQLDETTPVEPDPARRDAYTRAKIRQERACLPLAQTHGLDLWILRPGSIYGPDRVWTARLGYPKGGRVLCPGAQARVPAVHVDHVARALVAACTVDHPARPTDLPVLSAGGAVRIINLVDPDAPTQTEWLTALEKRPLKLPLVPILKLAKGLDLLADLVPALDRRLPQGAREATLAARFKPLRYGRARMAQDLGQHASADFATLIASARANPPKDSQ